MLRERERERESGGEEVKLITISLVLGVYMCVEMKKDESRDEGMEN